MHTKNLTLMRSALSLAAVFISFGPAVGHHSLAMFDTTQTETKSGTVVRFDLINPHSWLYVVIENGDGSEETWGFESSSPSGLLSNGWDAARIGAGEEIVVTFNPMRDGTNGGQLRSVVLSDGTEYCSGVRCRDDDGGPE